VSAAVETCETCGCSFPDAWAYDDHSCLSPFWMRVALGRPEECHEEVSRRGIAEPCEKVAVALRIDPNEGTPYPVCARHARANMVPLESIVRFMLDREEAQRVAAEGLVRLSQVAGT
jgi:hypothetical protein